MDTTNIQTLYILFAHPTYLLVTSYRWELYKFLNNYLITRCGVIIIISPAQIPHIRCVVMTTHFLKYLTLEDIANIQNCMGDQYGIECMLCLSIAINDIISFTVIGTDLTMKEGSAGRIMYTCGT